jgi:hypothetical protein
VKSQGQKMKMTEKNAKTATPHLRETPEQRQQIEHEDAIEDAGKDGKRVGAGFEKRIGPSFPLNSAFLEREVLRRLQLSLTHTLSHSLTPIQ